MLVIILPGVAEPVAVDGAACLVVELQLLIRVRDLVADEEGGQEGDEGGGHTHFL